jgi:hypothetical protein
MRRYALDLRRRQLRRIAAFARVRDTQSQMSQSHA